MDGEKAEASILKRTILKWQRVRRGVLGLNICEAGCVLFAAKPASPQLLSYE